MGGRRDRELIMEEEARVYRNRLGWPPCLSPVLPAPSLKLGLLSSVLSTCVGLLLGLGGLSRPGLFFKICMRNDYVGLLFRMIITATHFLFFGGVYFESAYLRSQE